MLKMFVCNIFAQLLLKKNQILQYHILYTLRPQKIPSSLDQIVLRSHGTNSLFSSHKFSLHCQHEAVIFSRNWRGRLDTVVPLCFPVWVEVFTGWSVGARSGMVCSRIVWFWFKVGSYVRVRGIWVWLVGSLLLFVIYSLAALEKVAWIFHFIPSVKTFSWTISRILLRKLNLGQMGFN
jgi:hypothetical protein